MRFLKRLLLLLCGCTNIFLTLYLVFTFTVQDKELEKDNVRNRFLIFHTSLAPSYKLCWKFDQADLVSLLISIYSPPSSLSLAAKSSLLPHCDPANCWHFIIEESHLDINMCCWSTLDLYSGSGIREISFLDPTWLLKPIRIT